VIACPRLVIKIAYTLFLSISFYIAVCIMFYHIVSYFIILYRLVLYLDIFKLCILRYVALYDI